MAARGISKLLAVGVLACSPFSEPNQPRVPLALPRITELNNEGRGK